MANAQKDENGVNSLIAASNADGTSINRVKAVPSSHRIRMSWGVSGSDLGPTHALKDDNDVSTLLAVSETDGATIVSAYCDTNGNLLITS